MGPAGAKQPIRAVRTCSLGLARWTIAFAILALDFGYFISRSGGSFENLVENQICVELNCK